MHTQVYNAQADYYFEDQDYEASFNISSFLLDLFDLILLHSDYRRLYYYCYHHYYYNYYFYHHDDNYFSTNCCPRSIS